MFRFLLIPACHCSLPIPPGHQNTRDSYTSEHTRFSVWYRERTLSRNQFLKTNYNLNMKEYFEIDCLLYCFTARKLISL